MSEWLALNTNLATMNVFPQDHALFQAKKLKIDPEQQYKPLCEVCAEPLHKVNKKITIFHRKNTEGISPVVSEMRRSIEAKHAFLTATLTLFF